MTDPTELGATLSVVAAALDALGCTWAIGGSLASAAYGEPRATNDVDVIATIDERGARALGGLLGSDFYADVDSAVMAVRTHGSFNVIDRRSFMKVDIFVPAPGPIGVGQLDRRQFLSGLVPDRPLPVLGAEDVVLQKLRWYAIGGEVSDRQWRDLVSVLRSVGPSRDDAYLDAVARAADLFALLERARRDAT